MCLCTYAYYECIDYMVYIIYCGLVLIRRCINVYINKLINKKIY